MNPGVYLLQYQLSNDFLSLSKFTENNHVWIPIFTVVTLILVRNRSLFISVKLVLGKHQFLKKRPGKKPGLTCC